MKKLNYWIFALLQMAFLNVLVAQEKNVSTETLLKAAGKFMIGARPDGGSLNADLKLKNEQILRDEFNAIQPTAYPGTWVSRYKHNLSNFQKWVSWGKQNNKKVMMHQLVSWNHYGPKWLIKGTWSKATLDSMLEYRIKEVVTSVKTKDVDVWNVVNEALRGWEDKGPEAGKFRVDSACVWNQLGWEADASGLSGADKINDSIPVYIRKAFEYTRKYTKSELELRDYMFEFSGSNDRKLLAFYQLTKHLQNKGVKVDAVGFQCHINGTKSFDISTKNWTNFQNNIKKFKLLGVKVYLTEVDIAAEKFKDIPFTDEIAFKQKEAYNLLTQQAIIAKVDGMFFWGVADGVDKGWYTYHKPLLFDENFNKKPAYFGVLEALSKK